MKILYFLLITLNLEGNLIYKYRDYSIYANWDTSYFYITLKGKKFSEILFATGNGKEGEIYFPFENFRKSFPLKLKNFLKYNVKNYTKFSYFADEIDLSFKNISNKNIEVKIKISQKIYENPDFIYFWIGLRDEKDSLFITFPKEKGSTFPLFMIPVDQDGDRRWDIGVNLESLIRIYEGKKKEEGLVKIERVKKMFNPESEILKIELKSNLREGLSASVFSLTGKKVRELEIKNENEKFLILWDGRDEGGKIQKSGVYLVIVKIKGETFAQIPVVIFR